MTVELLVMLIGRRFSQGNQSKGVKKVIEGKDLRLVSHWCLE
jgi:hypothetical protein